MFSKGCLNKFRELENTDDPQVDDELRKAWYIFIAEFCRSVSYHWKSYLTKINNRNDATFKGNLTMSDEAFAMWVVYCKYDEAKEEAEEIKKMGIDKWKNSRNKKRAGPHDSKELIKHYIKYYDKLTEARSNKASDAYWQKMFFDDLFKEPSKASSNVSIQEQMKQDGTSGKDIFELRLPGIDDEDDIVNEATQVQGV